MKLTAQDLSMYLGCQAIINDGFGEITDRITPSTLAFKNITCTPILKPLSGITEEEMKELYLLVFNRNFVGDNITHRDIGKKDERHVLWSGVERLFIYHDGNIAADCDLSYYRVHQPTIVKWMTSKGFDVFNWIPKGLAIDKTSIN